jgi:hypothetical protein
MEGREARGMDESYLAFLVGIRVESPWYSLCSANASI